MICSDTTTDDFLGGRLKLTQPSKGYRAGADPILLAASIPAKSGDTVLDLGCGVGAASFALATRVSDLTVTGIEVQAEYAVLARQNAEQNGISADIRTANLFALPADIRNQTYTHVISNPPYFETDKGAASQNNGKNAAFRSANDLTCWISIGAKRVAPKGWLSVVQRTDRLPDILAALGSGLGSISVIPVAAREHRAPHLVIVQAQKNGRGAFYMAPNVILHAGDAHVKDGDSYLPEIKAVLRDGAGLPVIR